jgi:hypothetical protein
MKVVVTERLDDVRLATEAAYADHVVSLDPTDAGVSFGYAKFHVASPVARLGGVAVVVGDAALDGVPDPMRILVRSERSPIPPGVVSLRRAALPVLLLIVDGVLNERPVRITHHRATRAEMAARGKDES